MTSRLLHVEVLFLLLGLAQAGSAGVELSLRGPHEAVLPGSFVTLAVRVRNPGSAAERVALRLEMPEGWKALREMTPLLVEAGEERLRLVTVALPSDAQASSYYTVSCVAQTESAGNAATKAHIQLVVRTVFGLAIDLLPYEVRAFPREVVTYGLRIRNRGNTTDRYRIAAISSHNWSVRPQPSTLVLPPRAEQTVNIVLTVPYDAAKRLFHRTNITAVSQGAAEAGQDVRSTLEAILEVLPSPQTARRSMYHTLPAQVQMGLRSSDDEPLEADIDFRMAGLLPDGYWMDAYLRRTIGGEGAADSDSRVDFGTATWDLSLGDTSAQFSRLVDDLRGIGLRFRGRAAAADWTVFAGEQEDSGSDNEKVVGAQVGVTPVKGTRLALTATQTQTDSGSAPAYRQSADARQYSILLEQQILPSWRLIAEAAGSMRDCDAGSGERGAGELVGTTITLKRLSLSAEAFRTDSDYDGRLTDREGYRAYGRYRLAKPVALWLSHTRYSDNVDGDPLQPTLTTTRATLGLDLRIPRLPSLSLAANWRAEQSDDVFPQTDTSERSLRARLYHRLGPFTLSLGGERGQRLDNLSDNLIDTSRYDASISGQVWPVTASLRYLHYMNSPSSSDSRRQTDGVEAMVAMPLLRGRLNASCRYGEEFLSDSDAGSNPSTKRADCQLRYRLSRSSWLRWRSEVRNLGGQDQSWLHMLTWTVMFDVPIPFLKVRARTRGRVFVDANANSLYDVGETLVPKAGVRLNDILAYTDQNGSFESPPLDPGTYTVALDAADLPVGTVSVQRESPKLELRRGQEVVVDIPLQALGTVRGIVYDDINRNGVQDPEEPGLFRARVVAAHAGTVVTGAFTDLNGAYVISNLEPTDYILSVDMALLPEHYQSVGTAHRSITLLEKTSLTDLNFGITEKPRSVIKTFFRKAED